MYINDFELIFDYILNRQPGIRGKTIFLKFRRIMFYRALLLLLVVPLDFLVMFVRLLTFPWQSQTEAITLTRMFPDLLRKLTGKGMVYAGPPSWAAIAWRQNSSYMPVSVPYVLLTLALYMPDGARKIIGGCALRWVGLLYGLYKANGAKLLVHSDALPFARVFVLQARNHKIKTICLQHGIFHTNSGIKNVDGYLCDLNVVRSPEDGEIIRSSNRHTVLCVQPDFFLYSVSIERPSKLRPTVTLLGEGWSTVDEDFSKRYCNRLRVLEAELLSYHYRVIFRPHPVERPFSEKLNFHEIDLSDLSVSMGETDVYLGFSSTVLIEAAAAGCVSAQISVDGVFNSDISRAGIQVHKIETSQEVVELMEGALDHGLIPESDRILRKKIAVEHVYEEIMRCRN